MILLLASIVDGTAVAFAAQFANAATVAVVTCRDLAEAPSRLGYPDVAASTITVRGQTVPVAGIAAVINLLPAVFPDELVFYPPAEREYQAAEFHALLTFFLAALPCPVVNRPTAASLTGPFANPLGWYHLAHRLSIPVAAIDIDSAAFLNPFVPRAVDTVEVSYLNGALIAPAGTIADEYTLALARQASVEYLRAVYDDGLAGPRLRTAHTVPDLRNTPLRQALLAFCARLA